MYVCFYCMFPLFLIVSCIFFHYSVLRVRFYNKINNVTQCTEDSIKN